MAAEYSPSIALWCYALGLLGSGDAYLLQGDRLYYLRLGVAHRSGIFVGWHGARRAHAQSGASAHGLTAGGCGAEQRTETGLNPPDSAFCEQTFVDGDVSIMSWWSVGCAHPLSGHLLACRAVPGH